MTIELLYWEGCPSHPQALAELRAALGELGRPDAEVTLRRVETEADAERLGFCGSPTIRVDGVDPVPPPADEPTGLTCRVYRLADGRYSPTPDPGLLREGLGATDPPPGRTRCRDDTPPRRRRARLHPARHRRRARPAARPARRRPWSSSRATTAPTRSHGTTASRPSARDYAGRGVRTLQICSNDAERYPRDAPDAMRARVQAGEFSGPYLHDATQEVARAWGARVTPDVFVVDSAGRLAYRGAPDADHRDESLRGRLRCAPRSTPSSRAARSPSR